MVDGRALWPNIIEYSLRCLVSVENVSTLLVTSLTKDKDAMSQNYAIHTSLQWIIFVYRDVFRVRQMALSMIKSMTHTLS